MKKKYLGYIACLLSVGSLVGCGSEADAYIRDMTAESLHGHVVEKFDGKSYKSGDQVTFTVVPDENFEIDSVRLNGTKCEKVSRGSETNSWVYRGTLGAGENKLVATYDVIKTADIVDSFKLNLTDEAFSYITSFKETGTKANEPKPDDTKLDLRANGIEQCRAAVMYNTSGQREGRADDSNFFLNCVDGDTTHMETFNLKYTVKIRYLMIDTPESTSGLEEWGLSASYYSKYIYWGEFGKEDGESAHYEEKVAQIFDDTDFAKVKAGATSIILMSQSLAYDLSVDREQTNPETTVTEAALKTNKYASATDGNQRDLLFVWYAVGQNPKKDDYRCLNLEMVYQGFSAAVGSTEEYGEYFYKYFHAAQMSATRNRRHAAYEGNIDPHYVYYNEEGYEVEELTLAQLYSTARYGNAIATAIGCDAVSPLADKKTLFAIEGYVSRMEGTAFYIQDQPSYTKSKVLSGEEKPYGLYIFTYAQTPIEVGMHVRVIGVLSTYGGTFQMQGINYTKFRPNANRDTTILDNKMIYDIEPIQLTVDEFHSLKLPQVLVQLTENVYFYDFVSDHTYKDDSGQSVTETSSIADGGKEELNTYSVNYYPYYNLYNSIIIYGAYGETNNAESINASHRATDIRTTNEIVRVDISEEVLVNFGQDGDAKSYRYFVGGEYYYNPNGAKFAKEGEEGSILRQYEAKKTVTRTMYDGSTGGIVGISHGYISTTRKTYRMVLTICMRSDIENYLEYQTSSSTR